MHWTPHKEHEVIIHIQIAALINVFKHDSDDCLHLCIYSALQQRAGSLRLSRVFWWAKELTSSLMKSLSNQQVSVTNVTLINSWYTIQTKEIHSFCGWFAVVGVKLNVSFWMNIFMNATLKLNVSRVKVCTQYLTHLYISVHKTSFLVDFSV